MHSIRQFQTSLSKTTSRMAMAAQAIAIALLLAAVPSFAQNTLPTTVQEAASAPASTPRSTHPLAAQSAKAQTPATGEAWTAKVLHSFNYNNGKDGTDPGSGLIFDAAGNLYGTTVEGGTYSAGTVFELTPSPDVRGGGH